VPALAQGAAAKITGLPVEKVKVHNQYLGGGFGRRLEVDNVIQAVAFAKLAKGPLKVIWTREEDIQHDMYRPITMTACRRSSTTRACRSAWFHRVTGGSSIMSRFAPPMVKNGVDPDAVEGAADLQYTIPEPARRVRAPRTAGRADVAFWRGVGPTHNLFVVESFIDELAHARQDRPGRLPPRAAAENPRTLAVLNLAAEKIGLGQGPLARCR
jgi:isoquinoline 1-oxidoreductase beta subunit